MDFHDLSHSFSFSFSLSPDILYLSVYIDTNVWFDNVMMLRN